MTVNDVAALSGAAPATLATPTPRAVDDATARQFRALMDGTADAPSTGQATAARPAAQAEATDASRLNEALDFDIEKVLMDHLPAADATPTEFALGMLRAQIKVSQAAIGIEMVAKTTQSLTQGVQSLTARS